LGVCSIYDEEGKPTITCPVRFRENWIIAEDAAEFFFPKKSSWTSLTEIRLKDANGDSAGNIDVVLVSYDKAGKIIDFGSLEVQGVYISGNVRNPFDEYMETAQGKAFDWDGINYPRADYLSSSRKRLAPQLLYKGGIFHAWKRKQAVALHESFYATLPELPEVPKEKAELVWFLYRLEMDAKEKRYKLKKVRTVYTAFSPAMLKITVAPAGNVSNFVQHLQERLDDHLGALPDAPTLQDMLKGSDK
jgi:hypothetical protein